MDHARWRKESSSPKERSQSARSQASSPDKFNRLERLLRDSFSPGRQTIPAVTVPMLRRLRPVQWAACQGLRGSRCCAQGGAVEANGRFSKEAEVYMARL